MSGKRRRKKVIHLDRYILIIIYWTSEGSTVHL